MFMLGEYVSIVLMCAFATFLFLGGWHALYPFSTLFGFRLVCYKSMFYVLYVRNGQSLWFYIWYDQLMRLGWKVFLPLSLVMVAVTATFVVFYK